MNSVRDEESANVSDVVDPAEERSPDSADSPISRLERVFFWGSSWRSGDPRSLPWLSPLIEIFFLRHPFIGYSDNMAAMPEAVATGHLQYGNPATQYVGTGATRRYLHGWLQGC